VRNLGAGESGKSTILKQMRLIHSTGFKTNERKGFRNVIFQNIIEAFLMMFDIMDAQRTAFEDQQNQVSWVYIFRHVREHIF
jgi:guanine nucleotide-binding protein subunit alpha